MTRARVIRQMYKSTQSPVSQRADRFRPASTQISPNSIEELYEICHILLVTILLKSKLDLGVKVEEALHTVEGFEGPASESKVSLTSISSVWPRLNSCPNKG
jgi:beta-N-acetylglucosaminidase